MYDEAFVQKGLDEEKVHTMLTLFNLLATSAAEASEAYSNAEALTNKQGHGFETIFSLLATSVT